MSGPRGIAYYQGNKIPLTEVQALILHTIGASTRQLKKDVIADRVGSEGSYNTIDVHVHRIRKALATIEAPNPIQNVWGGILFWGVVNAD